MSRGGPAEPTPPECALAAEMLNHFCSAGTMKQILALHREICNTLKIRPNKFPNFYPKLKAKLSCSWKAQALFKKFDTRANHKVYGKGRICASTRVLIIGAGPCGLRAAIECQLLGAKVVVIEKRDRISRNNVLHLWPFVIQDLRALGAKKFFGKFCAGSIDHISIRQLQCILLKAALLLGVEFHEGVSFEELLEPTVTMNSETLGWRARVSPMNHPVSQYEFDVLLGADGKRNTLQGFKRKEFRGKLAMAITANFINRHTEDEATVPEISGVAFIFNQKFFKDLFHVTGIDLENIVYYKDDTHYFVMTAKKHSLLNKGVLLNDYNEVSRLLNVDNVDRDALMRYAQEAARYSTTGKLSLKDFALNHYGEPDVALFDFTSMYAAENASMVYERNGRRNLCQLVGDSLLEPFWPTGSGCARGFLSALDAAWTVRSWGQNASADPLEIIAERESVYRLLAQTTPENLHRDFGAYTLDPGTRYPNLNRTAVAPHRVAAFYDTDEAIPLDAASSARKRRRELEVDDEVLLEWVQSPEPGLRGAASSKSLTNLLRRYRPDLLPSDSHPMQVYQVFHEEFGIPPLSVNGSLRDVPDSKLRSYLLRVYAAFKGEIPHIYHESNVFEQIKQSQEKEKYSSNTMNYPIAAYVSAADADKLHSSSKKKRRSVKTSQEEGRIVGGGSRSAGGGARVAQLAAELSGTTTNADSTHVPSKPKDLIRSVGKIEPDDWNMKKIERKIQENKLGRPEPKIAEKVPKWDREQFLGRQRRLKEGEGSEKWVEIDERLHKLDQKLRDSGRPDHGTNKVANLATKFVKKDDPEPKKEQQKEEVKKSWRIPAPSGIMCVSCGTRVFAAEGVTADGLHLHRACFRCAVCKTVLRPGNYTMERDGRRLVCLRHSGVNTPDAVTAAASTRPYLGQISNPTPERISVELSDSGAREIDEDEWTDRNFLASETSGAGGLSDEEDSSTEEYIDANGSDMEEEHSPEPQGLAEPCPIRDISVYVSDDSFGYDDYSDDGAVSSGNELCSRMQAAREARRLEVPADNQLPTDSSEVESEEESESSDEEISSATEVSTDSEFAREECAPAPMPPAILVTEATPPAPAPTTQDYPLSRTRSAGGLATKRALELKRKYLLGEPSPPAVRKSDSTSQMDTKFEAFRSTITEFQKLLHPATTSVTPTVQKSIVTFQMSENVKPQPMPDIIKNLCNGAPVDLLTKGDSTLCKDWRSEQTNVDDKEADVESDSLSDDSSQTGTVPKQTVPRVEVHNEGGELIQLDSLTIITSNNEDNEKAPGTATTTDATVVAAESESSESCRDVTTLALTETELSDWAAESVVLDDSAFNDNEKRRRSKNPRQLSGPKLIHDAKNVSALTSHVCGRMSPSETVVYSNAVDHFEFADEGEQDPTIERPATPKNLGYMELVDDDYAYPMSNDRSMNFIEKKYSETVLKSASQDVSVHQEENASETNIEKNTKLGLSCDIKHPDHSAPVDRERSDKSTVDRQSIENIKNNDSNIELMIGNINLNGLARPVETTNKLETKVDASPPLVTETPKSNIILTNASILFTGACSIRVYAPAICRSASETFHNSSNTRAVGSSSMNRMGATYSSDSMSPVSPVTERDMTDKVQEIKREREEQTELVRRLVLERLGKGLGISKKSTRRTRVSPCSGVPPPVPPPPPPALPAPPTPPPPPPPPPLYTPPPPRPAPPHVQVTPSFSDPELARDRRRKSIMKSISNYLNRRLGPRHKWVSEPELTWHEPQQRITNSHKSTGALQEAPPVPPPPVHYSPPEALRSKLPRAPAGPSPSVGGPCDVDERDAMQLWFEARWARLLAQRRVRGEQPEETSSRRLARLERRLSRPLSAEQQAATVAELVQVSAQRDAHLALMAADRRRGAGSSVLGD